MNAPTLLVGLGGTGSKIIDRVSKMVSEEQRKNIAFVVFDTDVNEQRVLKQNGDIKVIQTSTKLTVGEYLSIDKHARDTWFPVTPMLNNKVPTEGAGQVRAISRLVFETAVRKGKLEPLHEAIQSLYKLDQSQNVQALRVIIVSSLAGGTGSGLILPVALYIKNYLATHFRQSANITRGFFLLPEVFFPVIPGREERNNLCSNAYAALRELDAFLMKGDETLPDKFQDSVRMEFPRPASQEHEEYLVRPYDFCFLFDAQNADGCNLLSHEMYLDHAANCIFAQSIGPMNKRSNSSEDNTIRRLTAEKGRNRYAGAGCSMLVYPMEDVKEYIALHWARESVSSQWLIYDNMYKKKCQDAARIRAKGGNTPNPDPVREYIDTVESMAKNNNPFSEAIVRSCTRMDADGVTKVGESWTMYLNELMQKIRMDESSGQVQLDQQRSRATESIREITGESGDWSPFVDAWTEMDKYRSMVLKRTNEVARNIATTMFQAPNEDITADRLPHQLETYMRNADGNFVHPNAIRYFLYKAQEAMRMQKQAIDADNLQTLKKLERFAEDTFDDKTTEEVETVDSLESRKVRLLDKLRKRLSDDQEEMKQKFSTFMADVDKYRVNGILAKVLEEGIKYISDVAEAFALFFTTFESKVSEIDRRIGNIEQRYSDSMGMATRYVCASDKCLRGLAEQLAFSGDSLNLSSELCADIYTRVRGYAMMDSKPENNDYFADIFENGIIGFYKDALMKSYGDRVDMDVITALETEARLESNKESARSVEQYVINAIESTRKLSTPFIEKPLGEERDPILSCTYHPSLDPEDNSPKSNLVRQFLKDAGGEPDESISRNMVLFYQSFYGLRANDLSKFAPPEITPTSRRDGGTYYKAYFELIEKLHPDTAKSKAVTPHIDRWWHIVTKMPDLDEGNQLRQEQRIYSAFFWGLIGTYIYGTWEDGKLKYSLSPEKFGWVEEPGPMRVSNGTPCDRLYEALDALAIYPGLVTSILESVEKNIQRDLNNPVLDIREDGFLFNCLDTFRVNEYPIGEDKRVRSVLDIPMLMTRSVTPEMRSYFEENAVHILRAELDQIREYMLRVVGEKQLTQVMGDLLREQFEMFLKDVEEEKDAVRDVYHSMIFRRVCSTVAASFEELGLHNDARATERTMKELMK